ncbi:glycosyltransferase family 39 protein [Tundrisphaera sp. TA3]|uniref:glycosyltransferase family 39 protein n=1 Tax=Tundrisphaera sp. TA3 TaxID=3435775 RepID=UPI003EB771FC
MAAIPETAPPTSPGLSGRRWWLGCGLVLLGSLLATVPTAGDIGLTWDEPSYRTSQVVSAQWWEKLFQARSVADLRALVEPDALLIYWPYARFGYNFHPPLAGQLDLLTHALFKSWIKDIPSRRLASVFEYAATITLLFGFLARRYGAWVGGVAAGALLVMPRVYGDGHIAGTDMPGLFLWVATAFAFWKGINEPDGRRWRVLVGVLLGLGFVEKMAAVAVLGPLLLWLAVFRLPGSLRRRADWVDGLATSALMLLPLGVAFAEVRRLADLLPPPNRYDMFGALPPTSIPGGILLLPALVWAARRLLGRLRPNHPVWGVTRPALETWTAILAFAPLVGWLGNPTWWRETMVRMAHYYALSTDRQNALPDIRILYWGRIYEYSLPWHNAWVLMAITVPVGILLAGLVGMGVSLGRSWRTRDLIPLYFAAHFAFLPFVRMLPTPAHDGVRLFLPTFAFLAAFAGWGVVAMADALARRVGHAWACRGAVAGLVLVPAAWQLAAIHPFELSYYNEVIGGPRGAWKRGFELTYWYEAFDGPVLADANRLLPRGAVIDFLNPLTEPPTFACLQDLGALRGDIVLGRADPDHFPYAWILTHDSKATPFTRLLFAMTPWYRSHPPQVGGLPMATIASPKAVARAWALDLLTQNGPAPVQPVVLAPRFVRDIPVLGRPLSRLWGEGVAEAPPPRVDDAVLDWARSDVEGLRRAARALIDRTPIEPGSGAARLRSLLGLDGDPAGWRPQAQTLLRIDPEALLDAIQILHARPDAVRSVLLRPGYTDPSSLGGPLDRDLPAPVAEGPAQETRP